MVVLEDRGDVNEHERCVVFLTFRFIRTHRLDG
jgi:hypothetical protein